MIRGILLLREVKQRLRVAERLACGLHIRSAPGRPDSHTLTDIIRSVRPLLRTTNGDDERDAMVSCGRRDKHGGAEHRYLARMANQRSRQAIFDRVRALHGEGKTVADIVRQTGFDRRTIGRWIRLGALPQRNGSAPKTSSPRYFEEYLSRRWAEGCAPGRHLFHEIKFRGYTGNFSYLERLLAKRRRLTGSAACARHCAGLLKKMMRRRLTDYPPTKPRS